MWCLRELRLVRTVSLPAKRTVCCLHLSEHESSTLLLAGCDDGSCQLLSEPVAEP